MANLSILIQLEGDELHFTLKQKSPFCLGVGEGGHPFCHKTEKSTCFHLAVLLWGRVKTDSLCERLLNTPRLAPSYVHRHVPKRWRH